MRILIFLIAVIFVGNTANAQSIKLKLGECGSLFGGINPKFSSEMIVWDDVSIALDSLPWADTPYASDFERNATITMRSELHRAYTNENPGDLGNIEVPAGSEQFVADELAQAGIIRDATYPEGFCGGGDISYFVVSLSAAHSDLRQRDAFSSYISTKLEDYIVKGSLIGRKKERRTTVSNLPPHTPRKTVTVYVPSEVSRGDGYPNEWDKFDVVFRLARVSPRNYVIAVHTEGLKSAPRSRWRESAPSDQHYRAASDDWVDYEGEFLAAESVARFFAAKPSHCMVTNLDIDRAAFPFGCDGNVELALETD